MDAVVYGEAYNQAMQGVEDMLFSIEEPLKYFKKATYAATFADYCSKYADVIAAVERVYQLDEDPKAWCGKLAAHLTDAAEARLNEIPRKGKRSEKLIDYNMIFATYFIPAMQDSGLKGADAATDSILEVWNQRFGTSVGKATFEKISQGFNRRFCYVTTAVCESLGKADNCYELETLRRYRDDYLIRTEEGRKLVEDYYDIAPTIVKRIDREPEASAIYREIWEKYLRRCIGLIEEQKNEECRQHYVNMVLDLKGRYIA